jgi:predicted lactoylglutathione lyase
MELGAFSISLAVKDIETSRRFYEKFGFKVFAGDASKHWAHLEERRSRDRAFSRDV